MFAPVCISIQFYSDCSVFFFFIFIFFSSYFICTRLKLSIIEHILNFREQYNMQTIFSIIALFSGNCPEDLFNLKKKKSNGINMPHRTKNMRLI